MTRKDNWHEGTVGGTPPTTLVGSPDAYDTSSISGAGSSWTWDNTNTYIDHTSLKFHMASGIGTIGYMKWNIPATNNAYFRTWIYITQFPTVTTRLFTFLNSGSNRCNFSMNNTGKILSGNASNTTIATTTGSCSLNRWVRMHFEVTGISGTTGTVAFAMYNEDSLTPITNGTLSNAAQTVTSQPNEVRLGSNATVTQTADRDIWFARSAYSDVAQPGPDWGKETGWGLPI